MKTIKSKRISQNRMAIQGYAFYSENNLHYFKAGIKLPYKVCAALLAAGLLTNSIPILFFLGILAFSGVILPYHPVDYLYNFWFRKWLGNPKMPRRPLQFKFACTIATVLIFSTIYMMAINSYPMAYILGCTVLFSAVLVSVTDISIPSILYNMTRYGSIYPVNYRSMKLFYGTE